MVRMAGIATSACMILLWISVSLMDGNDHGHIQLAEAYVPGGR